MQLDLFMHGNDVMLQNDVITALRARNAAAAEPALAVFAAQYPQQEMIAPLTTLLHTLAVPAPRFSDHDDVASALHTMTATVAPAASSVFGHSEAHAWLAPLWRSLANAAGRLPFKAETPNTHSAFLLLQAGDWAAAEAAVAHIPSWRRMPATLAWMAESRFYQGGLEAVWSLLTELAWIDASRFSLLAHRLQAAPLHKLLKKFKIAFEDDDAPDPIWFPAWLLIEAPAMTLIMRETQASNHQPPERAARLLMEILTLEKQGRHAEIVARRKTLQSLHAGLYALYMASR